MHDDKASMLQTILVKPRSLYAPTFGASKTCAQDEVLRVLIAPEKETSTYRHFMTALEVMFVLEDSKSLLIRPSRRMVQTDVAPARNELV